MIEINDYCLQKVIGKGSFGKVYYSTKKGSKNKFAIKQLKITSGSENMENYKKEINILLQVNHPNIIELYEVFKSKQFIYLVFYFCNGGDLLTCLEKYKAMNNNMPFPEEIVQHLMKQIVSGVQYLHNREIIHRDLKLANILVKFDNEEDKNNLNMMNSKIMITDFGLSRYLKADEIAQSIVGTKVNMDPQILKQLITKDNNDSFGYDMKADIYSLGTICYHLLVGTPPFIGKSDNELMEKINKRKFSLPDQIKMSKESISFINGMLEIDPNKRYDINLLVKHAFLVKNCNSFHVNILKSINSKELDENNVIIINIKKKPQKEFWKRFKSINASDPENISPDYFIEDYESTIVDKSRINGEQSGLLGSLWKEISELIPGTDNNLNKKNEKMCGDKLEKMINNVFDIINRDSMDFEPLFIPLLPKINI